MLRRKTNIDANTIKEYYIKEQCYYMPRLEFEDNIPKILTTQSLNELYDITKFIHNLFVKNNIKYFAIGGTLLGAIRHGSFIPWDDDTDFAVVGSRENRNKISSLWYELIKNGYMLIKTLPAWSIQKIFNPRIHLDIFFIDKDIGSESNYIYSYPYISNFPTYAVSQFLWPNDSYNLINKPILKKFCDFEIYIPYDYNNVLFKTYGNKCFRIVNYPINQELHWLRIFKPLVYLVENLSYCIFGVERTFKLYKRLGKI